MATPHFLMGAFLERHDTKSIKYGIAQVTSGPFGHMTLGYASVAGSKNYAVYGASWQITLDLRDNANWHEITHSIKEARKSYAMGLALLMAKRMLRDDG